MLSKKRDLPNSVVCWTVGTRRKMGTLTNVYRLSRRRKDREQKQNTVVVPGKKADEGAKRKKKNCQWVYKAAGFALCRS